MISRIKKKRNIENGHLETCFEEKKKTTETSSDDEVKVSYVDKKKRKAENKKNPITFDHAVVTQQQKGFHNNHQRARDAQAGMQPGYRLENTIAKIHQDQSSIESINKRSRKELAKVRAQARRTPLNPNSSSDEDSQMSNSSYKLRSIESITKLRDCSFSKKSRASRTERYLKRHSRDCENSNNCSRISKSDAESSLLKLSNESIRTPGASPSQVGISYSLRSISSQSPNILGLSTVPPSHVHHSRFMRNSIGNSMPLAPLFKGECNNSTRADLFQSSDYTSSNKRYYSFDSNIHRPDDFEIIHAKLELGKSRSRNITLNDNYHLKQYYDTHQLPRPPPRDKKQTQCLDSIYQNNRYVNISPVQLGHNYSNGSSSPPVKKIDSFNLHSSFKSASEDYIPRCIQISLAQRPSSTTPVLDKTWSSSKLKLESQSDNYQYLTDKRPRSRKPIFIQNDINKSVSNKEMNDIDINTPNEKVSTAFLDQLKAKKSERASLGSSQICSREAKLKSNIFLPSVISNTNVDDNAFKIKSVNAENIQTERHSDIMNLTARPSNDKYSIKKISTNLEEALNELEAIYNSLKLGDEDLLEMAEKREEEVATKKILDNVIQFQSCNVPRGTLSDSGFSYKSFNSVDSAKRNRLPQHSPKSDDMAFRKINREDRAATITDPENVPKISYLFLSPLNSHGEPIVQHIADPSEPNITLDDVVYRTIKQSNKLQLPEHPPPFGIPLGPITQAANSDYLHVVPGNKTVKPNTIPDLVKDDLAYRNLRKDSNFIEPPLPPVLIDDIKNNNLSNSGRRKIESYGTISVDLKKKRAVRSKSANISSLICQEVIERASRRNARDKNRNTLSDIANTMQAAHQILKEKEIRINDNKKASLSDTDAGSLKYTRYPFSSEQVPLIREDVIDLNFEDTRQIFSKTDLYKTAKYLQPQADTSRFRSVSDEVSPDSVSSFGDALGTYFQTDSFEDVLTALAIEAEKTSLLSSFEPAKKLKSQEKQDDKKAYNYDYYDTSSNTIRGNAEHEADLNNVDEYKKIIENAKNMLTVESIFSFKKSETKANIDSDHDYENIAVDMKFEKHNDLVTVASEDFEETSSHDEADRYNSYNEGKKGVWCDKSSGEICVDVMQTVVFHSVSECACIESRDKKCNAFSGNTTSLSMLDINDKSSSFNFRSPDHQHLAPRNIHGFPYVEAPKLKMAEKLKSPPLVLETSKLSMCSYTTCNHNIAHYRGNRNSFEESDMLDNLKPTSSWTNYPTTFAIACSLGVAYFYELAFSNLFALVSIVFAVVAFIAVCFI